MVHVVLPIYKPKVGPPTKEQIIPIFKKHDTNGDGKLSRGELKAAYKELGSHWPRLQTQKSLWVADANHDGYIDIQQELNDLVAYASEQGFSIE